MSIKIILFVFACVITISCGGKQPGDDAVPGDNAVPGNVKNVKLDGNYHGLLKVLPVLETPGSRRRRFSVQHKEKYLQALSGKRLGIVDVGTARPVPPEFIDMLTVFLTGKRGVELVERSQIKDILDQQAISLSLGSNTDAADIVRAGKLLSAHGLIMLEAGKPAGGYYPLRVRLVDTRFGFKVVDTHVLLKQDFSGLEEILEILPDYLLSRMQLSIEAGKSPLLIGISTFRSTDVSVEWDDFGEIISSQLEQHLVSQPGVLLAERSRTQALTSERELTSGLPEALHGSAALVGGSFQADPKIGAPFMTLTLECRASNKKTFKITIPGRFDRPGELCGKAAGALLEKLELTQTFTAMAVEQEARFLVKQAEILLQIEEPGLAIPVLQAAMALSPRMLEPRALFVRAVNLLTGRFYRKYFARPAPEEQRYAYQSELFPLQLQSIESARVLLENKNFPPLLEKKKRSFDGFYSRHTLFNLLDYQDGVFSYARKVQQSIKDWDNQKNIILHMSPGLRAVFQAHFREVYDDYDPTDAMSRRYLQWCLKNAVKESRWWFSSPSDTVEFLDGVINTSRDVRALPVLDFQSLQNPAIWESGPGLRKTYVNFLQSLARDKSPMKQALAHRCFTRFYFTLKPEPDQPKAIEHYEQFLDILEESVLPRYQDNIYLGTWAEAVPLMWPGRLKNFDAPPVARLMRRGIRIFLNENNKNHGWRLLRDNMIKWSEAAGEPGEAAQLLYDGIQWLRKQNLRHYKREFILGVRNDINKLVRKYPQLKKLQLGKSKVVSPPSVSPGSSSASGSSNDSSSSTSPGSTAVSVSPVLTTKEIRSRLTGSPMPPEGFFMMGMIRTQNDIAVICVDGPTDKTSFEVFNSRTSPYNNFNGRNHIGILRLDPATYEILGYAGVDGLSYRTNANSNTDNLHSDNGPRRCANGDDVFLGLWDSGIVHFPANSGTPVHMTVESGLVSQDIVSSMVVHNDKLYAIVRHDTLSWGLMEVDWTSCKSQMLISPRGTDDQGDMQRMRLISVTSDPGSIGLIINALPPLREKDRFWGLYRYNPKSRRAVWLETVWPGQYARLSRLGSKILMCSREKIGTLKNVGSEFIQWQFLMDGARLMWPNKKPGHYCLMGNWKKRYEWTDAYRPLKCAFLDDGRMVLLAMEGINRFSSGYGQPIHLVLFTKGKKSGDVIQARDLPAPGRIVDIMTDTASGGSKVLLLTKTKMSVLAFQ